jgi:undecaprenyl diphosphate synthase
LVDFVEWCMQDGIEIATVYAFSTENWNRDPSEVSTLMSIFAKYAESLTTEASTRNVKVRILSTGKRRYTSNLYLCIYRYVYIDIHFYVQIHTYGCLYLFIYTYLHI